MIRKILFVGFAFVALYGAMVQMQVFKAHHSKKGPASAPNAAAPNHKVYFFSFSKYNPAGEKEIEIEGDSADILTRTVELMNVVAKAYAEETPVTITADEGNYDKVTNKVHLQKNVVATTGNGTRLLTEALDIHPTKKVMESDVQTEVKRDNLNIEGLGARGDSGLKKVKFKKNVTVVVQGTKETAQGPTVITCDGPLVIDYEKNIAHFKDNVVAEDNRGKLMADVMDVYYNKVNRQVSKIVAFGNVVIENPDGNQTFSDNAIYLAEEGRIILGGDTEAIYFQGDNPDEDAP